MIERYRDLILIHEEEFSYVVGCDSAGSIGQKPNDNLKVSAKLVGKTILKVAMAEVLSVSAIPIVVVDTLACEMEPTGKEILDGIYEELNSAGFHDVAVTGSTEENFSTSMTGIGITVIGKTKKERLKYRNVKKGMYIGVFGVPRVGNEVLAADDILSLYEYKMLAENESIVEILPCGSKGIENELAAIKEIYAYDVELFNIKGLNLKKSCGPASCCVVVFEPQYEKDIASLLNKPFKVIGRIV